MNNFNFNLNLIDTGKLLGPFTYSWNNDGTLSGIQYPNNTNLNITYHNRIQDNITLTKGGNTLFSADGGFDEKDRLTSEAIDITTPNGTISEDYSFSYDTLSRLSSMNYSSDNRTITYGYDGSVGDRLTSVNFSDTGTYNITYDTKGRIDYVTYPNNQGTENYTYNDPKGRLSNITYPDGKSLSFSWNSRGKLTQLTAVEGGTNTTFSFSYDGMNKISGYNKTTTKVGMPPQTENWNFYYGITGIEKATRLQNGTQNLTIDYSTDTKGNILSMNYSETGGFNGELFYTFDSFGNTSALTDNQGNVIVGYLYDLNNGAIKSEYNPQGIDNPYKGGGKFGALSIATWQNNLNGIKISFHVTTESAMVQLNDTWGKVNINDIEINIFGLITFETGDFSKCEMHLLGPYKAIITGALGFPCNDWCGTMSDKDKEYFKERGFSDNQIKEIENMISKCCDTEGAIGATITTYKLKEIPTDTILEIPLSLMDCYYLK